MHYSSNMLQIRKSSDIKGEHEKIFATENLRPGGSVIIIIKNV